ncbi:MAG TPA: sodium-dependent transporter, partial [Methanocorpusculum sp.]|nr:sodium-dependent transporter [Methanocorpusculum sp.]
YGMYLSKKENIEKSVHWIEVFDTGIALLAMLLIIPIAFVFSGGSPEALGSGPGLLFEQLPQVLVSLHGGGAALGIIFFLVVFIAALTSLFALIEAPVAVLVSRFKFSRIKALTVVCSIAAVLSLTVNFGYSLWKDVNIFGKTILDSFDILASNFLMPLASISCCIFIGWLIDTKLITDEVEADGQKFHWKKFFVVMVKYIAPVCILIIMISNIVGMFA